MINKLKKELSKHIDLSTSMGMWIWSFIEHSLLKQREELIEEIEKFSMSLKTTGNIDELYEINLGDLLRFLSSLKQTK